MAKPRFQGPKGTRDLYPEEALRRRYITKVWRDTAICHGFSEIDGPTFEDSSLYAVKSGDGILGELFQAFSGKSESEIDQVRSEGRAPFALRPEFTPTGARMFAARAGQLPKPTRWFNIGPRFRAERPQRGRLREFLQFDCDIYGDGPTETELAAALLNAVVAFGLKSEYLTLRSHDRIVAEHQILYYGAPVDSLGDWFALLDRVDKVSREQFIDMGASLPGNKFTATAIWDEVKSVGSTEATESASRLAKLDTEKTSAYQAIADESRKRFKDGIEGFGFAPFTKWCEFDPSIVRGLAYYTGTVFELRAGGERAVAGGGRYDKLIELIGGPPTPAVGFAMGDVVLSLLLEDKGLMPEGSDLLEACSAPSASLRPEVFVITPDESLDPAARRLVADLRRPVEQLGTKPWARPAGLHARATDKATRNVGKLIKEASGAHSHCALILESESTATLKNLDTQEERAIEGLVFSADADETAHAANTAKVRSAVRDSMNG